MEELQWERGELERAVCQLKTNILQARQEHHTREALVHSLVSEVQLLQSTVREISGAGYKDDHTSRLSLVMLASPKRVLVRPVTLKQRLIVPFGERHESSVWL